MEFKTYLFGTVEVSPEKVITFPNGLVGFEDSKRYMLVHEEGAKQPTTFTLQSLDDPALAFQLVDPSALGFGYELALSDVETALLESPAVDELVVMQVMFKKESDGKAQLTPNLRAPLLINTRARVGLQKVMEVMQPNVTLSNLVSAV